MIKISITPDNVDEFDFTESTIELKQPLHIGADCILSVWGVAMPAQFVGQAGAEDVYVAGLSHLKFGELSAAHLVLTPYDPLTAFSQFCQLRHGGRLEFRRQWGSPADSHSHLDLECRYTWPYSACSLKVWFTGGANLHVPEEDVIPIQRYVLDPERYGYNPASLPNAQPRQGS